MTYEIKIDFDATNWANTPNFSEDYDDISGDIDMDSINFIGWKRGKEQEEGNAPAATLEIHITPGHCDKYSPFTTGILANKIRPWLPIRVRAYYGGEYYNEFFGFISRISINPHINEQTVTLYCTDGTDLLARNMETEDADNTVSTSGGGAINLILDAAGWSHSRRNIDTTGGNIVKYPTCYEF